MGGIRAYFRRYAAFAMLIVALAITIRALVPAGYMANLSSHGLTVELCSSVSGKSVVVTLPQEDSVDHGKVQADNPCAFTALGQFSLSAADPLFIAIAIIFIIAAAMRAMAAPHPSGFAQLRPPLRGPPVNA